MTQIDERWHLIALLKDKDNVAESDRQTQLMKRVKSVSTQVKGKREGFGHKSNAVV
jgi:hypothetical protein